MAIQQAEFDLRAAWNELAAIVGTPELSPAELVGDFEHAPGNRELDTEYAAAIESSPLLFSGVREYAEPEQTYSDSLSNQYPI